MLRESVRPDDLAYRSGGDEFAVILPDAGRIEGEGLYARVQATLRRRPTAPDPCRQPLGRHRRAEAGRRRRLAVRARRAGAPAGQGGRQGNGGLKERRPRLDPVLKGSSRGLLILWGEASASRLGYASTPLPGLGRSVLDRKLLVEARARARSGRSRRRRSPRAPRGAPAPRLRTSRTAAARPARS